MMNETAEQKVPTSEENKKSQENEPAPAATKNRTNHPLKSKYSFWYVKRAQRGETLVSYEKNMKQIGHFDSAESYWALYNHIMRPNDLHQPCDYQLFKYGIKPLWEHEANKNGGKFVIRVTKKSRLTSKYWEDLILALIGEQFGVGDEICGVVVSVRYKEDLISVWNRNADNLEARTTIQETLKRVFNLPSATSLEYKPHN
eukprot:TRINITY_DN1353_c0_g1_i2.p1 TRINITY_DN1353_c0_g1~~TRINITY_DN1353_c0_g1_i2.p1  ORF type:complete len:201 (+),score=31.48 TRINITY_DN1353_c0_g1_i2:96-698(+)